MRQGEKRAALAGQLDQVIADRDRQVSQLQSEIDRLIGIFRGPAAYTGMQAAQARRGAEDEEDPQIARARAECEGLAERYSEWHGDLSYDELLARKEAHRAAQEKDRGPAAE